MCRCTYKESSEKWQKIRGEVVEHWFESFERYYSYRSLESSEWTYWTETVLKDDSPSVLLFKVTTACPPIPLHSLCLVLWEGIGWLRQNLGTPWRFAWAHAAFTLLIARWWNQHMESGRELGSSLNYQRNVDLVCTTVNSLHTDPLTQLFEA